MNWDSNDEQDDEMNENTDKNPSGLHQTEIIASLALNLRDVARTLINPITHEPFRVKFGNCSRLFHFPSSFVHTQVSIPAQQSVVLSVKQVFNTVYSVIQSIWFVSLVEYRSSLFFYSRQVE